MAKQEIRVLVVHNSGLPSLLLFRGEGDIAGKSYVVSVSCKCHLRDDGYMLEQPEVDFQSEPKFWNFAQAFWVEGRGWLGSLDPIVVRAIGDFIGAIQVMSWARSIEGSVVADLRLWIVRHPDDYYAPVLEQVLESIKKAILVRALSGSITAGEAADQINPAG